MSDNLEQELRNLTPLPPTAALDTRIAHHLLNNSEFTTHHSEFPPTSFSDKLLLTTLSLAAAAALFIITLLASDYLTTPAAPPAQLTTDFPASTPFAQTQQLLAQLTNDNTNLFSTPQTTQPHF
jgi:hypothetical protein